MSAHFDCLVVGAGTAGCAVASRLSENPARRVGLVEAGGPAADPDIADPLKWPALYNRPIDWAYRTAPQAHTANRVHEWPRGRLAGGSSALNAMAHVRGHPRDFAPWAEAAGPRWSYEGLLPGFLRGEARMRVWLPDEEVSPLVRAHMAAGEALGAPRLVSHNGAELIGAAANTLTIRDGRRVTAADAYLTPEVLARPNLTLLLEHTADQLVLTGDRVTGLRLVHGGEMLTVEADRIVLCLGAVATPLLLMRSGIGDAATLKAAGIPCRLNRSEVGRNLQDHLLLLGNLYAARKPVPPSRLQHSESLMYLGAEGFARTAGPPDIALACVVAPAVSEAFAAPAYGSAYTLLCGVTHPTSRGAITPTGPTLTDPPRIDPRYLSTDYDRRTMRLALELAREVGHHAALAEWRSHELLPDPAADPDAFIARAASTHHHPAGACRMGRDENAVVDDTLAVNGLRRLAIADASVFPTLPSGPINAAILALAETWTAEVDGR